MAIIELVLLCLLLCGFANPHQDTTDSLPTASESNRERLAHPQRLLVLLIDGMRWDLLTRFSNLTNVTGLIGFEKLKSLGGYVKRVAPVFPAECYPNIYSILTGRYPVNHGAIFSTLFDEAHNRTFRFDGHGSKEEAKDWLNKGQIWETWSSQNRTIHLYDLPVCPSVSFGPGYYCAPYNSEHMTPENLKHTLDQALTDLEDGKADVTVVYYDKLDQLGHMDGPLSNRMLIEGLLPLDQIVSSLVDRMQVMREAVNLVVTADHGMTEVNDFEFLDRSLSLEWIKKLVNRGSTVGIWPFPEHYQTVYRRLSAFPRRRFSLYNKTSIPQRWRTGGDRFPPILLVMKPGYLTHSDYWPMELGHYPTHQPLRGAHGYDPELIDMHVPLLFFGPGVRPNSVYNSVSGDTAASPHFDHVHTHALIAKLSSILHNDEKLDVAHVSHLTGMLAFGPVEEMANVTARQQLYSFYGIVLVVMVVLLLSLLSAVFLFVTRSRVHQFFIIRPRSSDMKKKLIDPSVDLPVA